jgi:iron(II)-dependent oxidoreductase
MLLAIIACARPSQVVPVGEPRREHSQKLVLIPAGKFLMGHDSDGDHSPVHKVRIDAFYLDAYEVTNAEYLEFCREKEHGLPQFWEIEEFHSGPEFPDHPVIGVSWVDAKKYAEWRGMRLPTEAEWEYAARGGLEGKLYAHGDDLDPTVARYWDWGSETHEKSDPVGSYPPNGYGLYDMTGNVAEWVADVYVEDFYSTSVEDNPRGPKKGKFRVVRGGGWHSGPSCVRVHFRAALSPGWVDFNVGFRCARDIEESPQEND